MAIDQAPPTFLSYLKERKSIKCLHGLPNILGLPKLSVCVVNTVLHLTGYMYKKNSPGLRCPPVPMSMLTVGDQALGTPASVYLHV